MAKNSVFDYDTVAANNLDIASISLAENITKPSDVNNIMRNELSQLAQWRQDLGGGSTTAGTNTITVTANQAFTSYAAGQRFLFKLGGTAAAGATTLNITPSGGAALGAKPVKFLVAGVATDPTTGQLTSGNYAEFQYDGTNMNVLGSAATTFATNAQTQVGTNTTAPLNAANLASVLYAGTDNSGGATITMGDGGKFNLITSTTAITAFAFTNDAIGRSALIRFNTGRTLTYNATSLIIPGAANKTTAQGDVMQITSLGSGNFRVDWYTPATTAAGSSITLGSPTASTSGTAINFTGIPAGVKRVTFNYSNLSTTGTSQLQLRIGSGSVVSTGYVSSASAGSSGVSSATTGFALSNTNSAASVYQGSLTLSLVDASTNTWIATMTSARTDSADTYISGGMLSLGGALDRVQLTTAGGTDTFDAGKVNIMYES